MRLHVVEERLEPAGRHLHVRIEQEEIGGIHLGQGPVVALGESVVLGQADEAHRGELAPEHLAGVVRGTVVGHNDLGPV